MVSIPFLKDGISLVKQNPAYRFAYFFKNKGDR